MKKVGIAIAMVLLSLALYLIYVLMLKDTKNMQSIYLVPEDAMYILASDEPLAAWKKVSESGAWQFLQTNDFFKELSRKGHKLDSLIADNKGLLKRIGEKNLLISAHPTGSQIYDFLFVVDLQKTAQFGQFKTILKKIISKDFRITERQYEGVDIIELFDRDTRETLSLSLINNNLIASYTHTLVEAAIAQYRTPVIGRDLKFLEIQQKTKASEIFQLYVPYKHLELLAQLHLNTQPDWVKEISHSLIYSGFDIGLTKKDKLFATGFTNTNDQSFSYLKALSEAGSGKQRIAHVAPQKTGLYMSIGFSDFNNFYKNLNHIKEQHPKIFKQIDDNRSQIEKLLDIDAQKDIFSWIGDEIAILELDVPQMTEQDNFAFVIKTKDVKKAKNKLDFITERIKKKTPLKFKEVEFQSYPIKFLSVKGFFKLFLGGLMKEMETPYYTIIEDYVVFSNHPNTLKYIITAFKEKKTLDRSIHYREFKKNFMNESNVFVYMNTPLFYPGLLAMTKGNAKTNLQNNKAYMTAFSQVGFQLIPKDGMYKTLMAVQYMNPDEQTYSEEFMSPQLQTDNSVSKENTPIITQIAVDPFDVPDIHLSDLNASEFVLNHPNGKLKLEVELKDGLKDGRYRSYYPDGQLYVKGTFKNDKRAGKWKKYNPEGKKILQKSY